MDGIHYKYVILMFNIINYLLKIMCVALLFVYRNGGNHFNCILNVLILFQTDENNIIRWDLLKYVNYRKFTCNMFNSFRKLKSNLNILLLIAGIL